MNINELPHHILYHVCQYLSFEDVKNLSQTSKQLYVLIENNDYFWMILIKNHFGSTLYRRYVHEIFQNEKNSDFVFYRTKEDIEKFEKYLRKHCEWEMCVVWLFNVLNCKDNINGYIAHQSLTKQKQHPRTNEFKMSLTKEEFFRSYLYRNKYLNEENIHQISFYKLLYYYFIEKKRLLSVDLFPICLGCTPRHRACPIRKSFEHEDDPNSFTSQCVRLYSNGFGSVAGIKGQFQSILSGIYQFVCRIRLDKNNDYLTHYNERCSRYSEVEKSVECSFYAIADYGLDCQCDGDQMNFDWFESNYLLYGNTNWFNQTMGIIKVFELSNIYFGFRIRGDCGYRNVLFDYIQLNIVE